MSNHKKILLELFNQTSYSRNTANCVHDLLGDRKIILYGGGDGFIGFSSFILRKYGFKIHAVLDQKFKAGDVHFGIPAFSPVEYKPTNEERENSVVVIVIGKKEYHQEIFQCLRNLGFKNVILSTDIYEYHLLYPPEELQKHGFGYYLNNKDQVMRCLELFADDLSGEIFTCFIQTHMQRKIIPIPSSPLAEQYFPKDIKLKKGYSRFINCGAYDGDTIRQLNALHGRVDAVACFEPDAKNFRLLAQYLCANHDNIAQNIVAFPCGVFDGEAQIRFSSGDVTISAISDNGDSLIQCTALDNALPGFKPTFISIDVEGSEPEALRGAEKLIKENRPDLGISVYHAPNHIWDIPLYLENLHVGYRFYLRNYTSFTSETILYATSEGIK